ncbi:hypothetical protein Bbelb_062410 [Branchiostoma belcheri]|nr:hypothetical protein Bbelb_062410 [Branchiostoma belcheri]
MNSWAVGNQTRAARSRQQGTNHSVRITPRNEEESDGRCWGGMVVLEEFAESCPFEAVAAPCVVKTLCYRKLRVSGHVMLAGEIPRYDPDWPYQHNYTTQ